MDLRLPVLATVSLIAVAAFLVVRKREIRRLHHERGYDAHDPNIDREADINTKDKFRSFNTKGRGLLDVFRGVIFTPVAALLSFGFIWAAFPTRYSPTMRWDMVGIGVLFLLAALFFGRMLFRGWRVYKGRD